MAHLGPARSTNAPLPSTAARGRCGKHGGSRGEMCKDEGCTTRALGAHGTCKFAGCSTNATSTSPYCANKALERKSRAPWRDAPPPLHARVSAQNTAAFGMNVFCCLGALGVFYLNERQPRLTLSEHAWLCWVTKSKQIQARVCQKRQVNCVK